MNPILLFLGLAFGLSCSLGAAPNGPVPPAPIFDILLKAYAVDLATFASQSIPAQRLNMWMEK
jgi:hypothetical protein